MDTVGKIYIAITIAAFIGALVGFYFLARKGPRGAVLIVAVALYCGGMSIPDSNVREVHLLEGILRLTGFVGGILGIIDLLRKRRSPGPTLGQQASTEVQSLNKSSPSAASQAEAVDPTEDCPWCEAKVIPDRDGRCPACHRPIA